MLRRLAGLAAACLAITAPSLAQPTPFEARYDDAIPSIEDFAGYETGAEITAPEVAVDYLRALADAAPERMQVFDYATSWQGRDLVYGVIASPERPQSAVPLLNLEAITGTTAGRADALMFIEFRGRASDNLTTTPLVPQISAGLGAPNRGRY